MSTAYNARIPGAPQAGAVAPADGSFRDPWPAPGENSEQEPEYGQAVENSGSRSTGRGARATDFGSNFECLEELRPALVNALRDLVRQYREEGIVARRHEIRRIRQARLFWQGLQYAWWNPNDMNWHLPFEQKFTDDRAVEEMPRYQFVTNFYQGFGLSFIAVLSQDVPTVRFYPQSAQSLEDISAARAASDVAALVEQNNHVEQLLTAIGYFLWTDGKLGGYVRYVADGQRFGFHDEEILEAIEIPLGEDVYVCAECGKETPASHDYEPAGEDGVILSEAKDQRRGPYASEDEPIGSASPDGPSQRRNRAVDSSGPSAPQNDSAIMCSGCGAKMDESNLRRAERVQIPRVAGVRRVPNGQEVITITGGLELNTPVWAGEMHEYPYLQWQSEVHRAKLKAAYPHAADKIEAAPPEGADDVYARASRISVSQGLPSIHPGDALGNLVTFSRTWIRPWSFYAIEDQSVRDELLRLFPDGCYVAFAADAYCEARNESMDDHWRVLHALPGDGQNRPSVGDSLVQVQERYNALSNMQAETYEFGIPPIYADPQVLDFDALQNQVAEPAAHYPARARPGQPLAAGFFQPAPATVPPDMLRHQQDLIGPISQFLTGLFPAIFGGNMEDVKTASGYALARDQAMGRLGLVWRRLKQFYADLLLLGVDCFRKNRPGDVEIPALGPDGVYDSKWIRLADLKGNIQAHPEADETFPRAKSQQRAVLQQLFGINDPLIQRALTEPANIGYIKNVIGLSELVVPGEDSRNKQLREIQQLLASAPIVVPIPAPSVIPPHAPPVILNAAKDQRPGVATFENEPIGSAVSDRASQQGNRAVDSSGPPAPQNDIPTRATRNSGGTDHEPRITDHESLSGGVLVLPSVPIDELLDDHAVEFEECKRWANSDSGQAAKVSNPAGFANVRAHAEAHLRAMRR